MELAGEIGAIGSFCLVSSIHFGKSTAFPLGLAGWLAVNMVPGQQRMLSEHTLDIGSCKMKCTSWYAVAAYAVMPKRMDIVGLALRCLIDSRCSSSAGSKQYWQLTGASLPMPCPLRIAFRVHSDGMFSLAMLPLVMLPPLMGSEDEGEAYRVSPRVVDKSKGCHHFGQTCGARGKTAYTATTC